MSADTPSVSSGELPPVLDHIDGRWVEPSLLRNDETGAPAYVEHASNGSPCQQQRATDGAGIEAALASAWQVHRSGSWARLDDTTRADLLDTMAEHLESEVPSVAALESATTGAVIGTTTMFGFILHGAFRLAAAQLRDGILVRRLDGPTGSPVEIERLPWGPALLLCPWNAPAPMAAHKAASALAAGCPVIVKPPERAPHGTAAIARAAEAAGLPTGVVQLVHGGPEVASALMTDDRVRAVSFTGGSVGGRAVAHACAEGLKPAQLELGGHSPLVVMPGTPPERTAEAVTALLTTLNGQWCRALGRVIVADADPDAHLDACLAALGSVRLGDPLDPASGMGPIVHSDHRRMLSEKVADAVAAGGRSHTTTPVPDRPGNWMAPTLVTGVEPARSGEEVFGPVAFWHSVASVDDAVELANGTRYGLEAYVVSADGDEAAALDTSRRIIAGGVKVNGVSPMSLHLMAPRPAFGISGLAEEGTVETIQFFAGNRVLGVEGSLGISPTSSGPTPA